METAQNPSLVIVKWDGLANFVKNVFPCLDVSMDTATKAWSALANLVGMECFVIDLFVMAVSMVTVSCLECVFAMLAGVVPTAPSVRTVLTVTMADVSLSPWSASAMMATMDLLVRTQFAEKDAALLMGSA